MGPGGLWWTNVLNSTLPPQRLRPDMRPEHQDPVSHTESLPHLAGEQTRWVGMLSSFHCGAFPQVSGASWLDIHSKQKALKSDQKLLACK